jgi:hypothetical protein
MKPKIVSDRIQAPDVVAVPEPASALLLATACAALLPYAQRRRAARGVVVRLATNMR